MVVAAATAGRSRCWRDLVAVDGAGCWRWTGRRSHGVTPVVGERSARRVIWEELRGGLPAGVRLRSSCGRSDCVHPDHVDVVELHRHGARRYDVGCRCPVCRRAHLAKQQAYRFQLALDAGRVPVRPVNAVAARRHLEALFAVGWTYRAVARRAGVSIPTLVRLRRGPRSTIGPAVATRVLAVGGPPGAGVDPLPRRRRPAAPLRRHVDELHTAGWSWTAIGQRTGISEAALRRLRAGITRDVDAARASRLFALGDP